MQELNTTLSVEVVDEDGYDALTIIDLGEPTGLSVIDEQGELHDIILGPKQFAAIAEFYKRKFG